MRDKTRNQNDFIDLNQRFGTETALDLPFIFYGKNSSEKQSKARQK